MTTSKMVNSMITRMSINEHGPATGINGGGLEALLYALRKNTIRELKIGWHDCDFLRQGGPRSTALLTKAIRYNTSLTHVMIGWRRRNLSDTLRLMKALTASRARLLYLDLSLDDSIPADVLSRLLASQQYLVEIHIRAVRVYVTTVYTKSNSNQDRKPQQTPPSKPQERKMIYRSIVEDCILSQYRGLPCWKVLSLIDCNLTDCDLLHLADFLHLRGGLAEVRLRSNRQVSGAGLLHILQAPVLKKLDLSLCDLQPDDGVVMAMALSRRPWPLGQLILAGNYRLGAGAIALVDEPCVGKIGSLDLSYSVHTDSIFAAILGKLGQSLHNNSRSVLQRIAIRGAWNESTALESLEGLLWQQRESSSGGAGNNTARKCSLRSLQLNNPHSPVYLSVSQVQSLECALRDNYELEDLGLDYPTVTTAPVMTESDALTTTTSAKDAVNNLQFWLRLNSAGRRIVQCLPPSQGRHDISSSSRRHQTHHKHHASSDDDGHDEWVNVVEKAGRDSLTVLYWIIRNSADRFRR